MHSSRWLFIPSLALALSGCSEEAAPTSAVAPDGPAPGVSAPAQPAITAKMLSDSTAPDPNKFQVGPDPRKPTAVNDPAKVTDAAKKPADATAIPPSIAGDATGGSKPKAPDVKNNAEKKAPDTEADAEKKAPDVKADAEKKAPDVKADAEKKGADAKSDAPLSPRELLSKAREAVKKDDVTTAISLLEKVIAGDPKNHEALLNLALLTQREATTLERPKGNPFFLKSAAWIRQLRAAIGKMDENETRFLAMAIFNEARTYAVQGDSAKAIKSLGEAADLEKHSLAEIKSEEDFATLRKLPEYEALIKRLEEKAAIALRKEAEEARAHAKITMAKNEPFKFSFELPDVNGKKVSLADFKGKVVIVDVWGTWCPPCRKEIPHLIELYKKLHEKGLEIVGINYEDAPDSEAKKLIKEYIDKVKIPYPCVIGNKAVQQQIPKFEGFPTTLFIDRTGKVRAKTEGFEESTAAELEEIVTILVNEPAPKS